MPLLVPVAASQTLPPEDLEPLKEALLRFLRGRNAQVQAQVDANLHVTKGERIPAYAFTLEALLETRQSKAEEVTKPLSAAGAAEPPAAGGGPPQAPPDLSNIWAFPSENRADFSPFENTYFVPNTLQTKDCMECFQKGESTCKQCFGKGEEACQTCLGAGTQQCAFCKGLERVTCLRCGGEGRLTAGGTAGASRAARCDACNGTGKFPCTHCKEGKLECAGCHGSGRGSCRKCQGKGKISCTVCEGMKRVVAGWAFHAEFKPFKAEAAGLIEPGPKEALELAMQGAAPVGSLNIASNEPLEKQIKDSDVPVGVKSIMLALAEKLKGRLSATTKAVKHRLELAEGSVVRLNGYCAGQEFSFWMVPGKADIVTEKDPLSSLGTFIAISAEEAQASGDWKKALELAEETLAYMPGQGTAENIIAEWRSKVFREAIGGGFLLSVIAATVFSLEIAYSETGLNKSGAIMKVALLQLGLGLGAALALFPILLRLHRNRLRWPVLGGVLALVFAGYWIGARWVFDWNPVRTADQTALRAELHRHFRHGLPSVYYEPDLRYMQNLYAKYKDSQADLSELKVGLDRQLELQKTHLEHQRTFESKLAKVVASGDTLPRKQKDINELKEYYRLLNLDLTPADRALDQVNRQTQKTMFTSRTKRQSIVISGAKPKKGKKAPAPAKSAVKPSKTGKGAKPAPILTKKASRLGDLVQENKKKKKPRTTDTE